MNTFAPLMLLLSLGLTLCQDPGTVLKDEPATMRQVGELGFVIIPDSDTASHYIPDQLDETYRRDGLRVVFSGVVGTLPDDTKGRAWGTPLKLTKIALL